MTAMHTISPPCRAVAEPPDTARWNKKKAAANAANIATPAAVVAGDTLLRGVNRVALQRNAARMSSTNATMAKLIVATAKLPLIAQATHSRTA